MAKRQSKSTSGTRKSRSSKTPEAITTVDSVEISPAQLLADADELIRKIAALIAETDATLTRLRHDKTKEI